MKLLPHRSDARLASLVTKTILNNIIDEGTVLDIGCGDGIVSKYLKSGIDYRGIDLTEASIYEKNTADSRILYCSSSDLDTQLDSIKSVHTILLLDVLEHTREFVGLFRRSTQIAEKFLVVSLPNEQFIYDRIRFLLGQEHPAHSLDLLGLPEGFKHQYIVNIGKAKELLRNTAEEEGFELMDEWCQPLVAKNRLVQPVLFVLRALTRESLWSTGSIFVFRRRNKGM